MGVKEEQTGNVVKAPAIVGEPWWLLKLDGTEFCCHMAPSWFKAREIGRALTGEENISARLAGKVATMGSTENKPYIDDRFEWRGNDGAYEVLDHGYLKVKRTWGSDEEIIETARMSTSKGFLGWDPGPCPTCAAGVGRNDSEGCRDCGGKGTVPGDAKLLRYLYEHKHSTPFEFAGLTIECQAPIMVYREWHRHRTQAYSEMSARYVQMPNLHYVPSVRRIIESSKKSGNRQASGGGALSFGGPSNAISQEEIAESIRQRIKNEQQEVYDQYEKFLSWGVSKEIARLNTPVSRYSRMRATGNLRNWLAFLTLRMDPAAQFEIRQYAWCVADAIEKAFPRTWALHFESMQSRLG
jgi:thymidylate synthase (FAD)